MHTDTRRPGLALAGAAALILAVGLAAGRWTAGADEPGGSTVAATRVAPPAASPPPPDVPARRPSPDGRSERGAISAAAGTMADLARPELLFDPARRRAVVERIATPGYRAELGSRFDRGYEYMAGRLGTDGPEGVVMRLVPLGARVESMSRARASVAVWQVLLLGAPGGRVVATWSTSRADLRWAAGRWRVARFGSDEPGPGPALTNLDTATPPEVFRVRLDGLEPLSP